jgi:hypothetical protein
MLIKLLYPSPRRSPDHALASDYIHRYKDAGDLPPGAAYGSTFPTICVTLPWLWWQALNTDYLGGRWPPFLAAHQFTEVYGYC